MRLDKYICECTQLTRSLATQAIRNKRVTINDVIIKSASTKVSTDKDIVTLDSQPLVLHEGFRYYMMHKPPAMVCANTDFDHPIIFDIMYDEPAINKLHTVGRLDLDTTGLLLITDEKELTQSATLERISNTEVLVTLNEGKYHQVKRMFAALGNHVEGLHREKIGGVSLDEDLGEGEYRELSPEEINSLARPS